MAAAGSAIGLGNIWSFPSQVAKNGGAAFVFVYLILTFLLAYPALMAEITIGRYTRSNPVGAFKSVSNARKLVGVGFYGLLCVGLILSFYAIVGGWMIAYFFEPICLMLGLEQAATWVVSQSIARDILFTTLFFLMTILVITASIQKGIEAWSKRLMPLLLVLLLVLISYVLTLDGALVGLKNYLVPDFSKVWNPSLIVSAMGQVFFSVSLGAGTMVVYGSYISKKQNLSRLSLLVVLFDLGVAFLAGLLIIPAMYAAATNGTKIFDADGNLMEGDSIVFQVLPALFNSMDKMGHWVALIFFLLMIIAALTSSISMLEVPVSYVVDEQFTTRKKASWLVGGAFWLISILIICNFDILFDFVIVLTTQYSQPLLGVLYCIFAGWLLRRDKLLKEVKQGFPHAENSFFFKVWPIFVKFITPLLIITVFVYSLFRAL